MAKFSGNMSGIVEDYELSYEAGDPKQANYEPTEPPARLVTDSTRMAARSVAPRHLHLGLCLHRWCRQAHLKKLTVITALLVLTGRSKADPTTTVPDVPPRKTIPRVGPSGFPPSWDLDGLYLWLGPSAAASHVDTEWDSTIGADAAVIRIREQAAVAAIGGSLGASRWTVRGGGRIWLDAMVGTRVVGRMAGLSAGPIVELSDFSHPRLGGSIGVWTFIGITPFARLGTVQDLGMFGEVGVHIALPVFKRR
ncbi:MAG: hypothetical protein H0V17_22415 [Deltaproteobacteria bacterium]|nr:hypothetical protein [Deltaproteobacteria bacterium]